jgi:DMSO/TMAO reductase YedYZ molybdopterin-dependent catalytic subunit
MRSFALLLTLVAVVHATPNRIQAPAGSSVKISGDVQRAPKLTAEDIAKMPHVTVQLTEKDGSQTAYSGVALTELLRQYHVITGEHVSGKSLATYLLVTAKDGYQVVFGLGELDTAVSDRTVILADQLGGAPLNDKLGPFRIVVGGDKKQARCIRMVTELKVVKLRP